MGRHMGFGRTTLSGRAYLGTHKPPVMGMGKHDDLKKNRAAAPPPSAFSRPEMNGGPHKIAQLNSR